ncbi:MAG: hypothetical protein ABIC40_08305, partial [bacterium]
SPTGWDAQSSDRIAKLRSAASNVLDFRPTDRYGDGELILTGWRENMKERALISPKTRSVVEQTLYLIHIPLRISRGTVTTAVAKEVIVGMESALTEVDVASSEIALTDGRIIYMISIPPVQKIENDIRALTMNLGISESTGKLRVIAFDNDKHQWIDLHRTDTVEYRYNIFDPVRFLGPDNRSIFIAVESDPKQQGDHFKFSNITAEFN